MTIHFDSPISDKIPIPKIDSQENQHIADGIVNLVDKILRLKATRHSERTSAKNPKNKIVDSIDSLLSTKAQNDEVSNLQFQIDDLT